MLSEEAVRKSHLQSDSNLESSGEGGTRQSVKRCFQGLGGEIKWQGTEIVLGSENALCGAITVVFALTHLSKSTAIMTPNTF